MSEDPDRSSSAAGDSPVARVAWVPQPDDRSDEARAEAAWIDAITAVRRWIDGRQPMIQIDLDLGDWIGELEAAQAADAAQALSFHLADRGRGEEPAGYYQALAEACAPYTAVECVQLLAAALSSRGAS